MVKFGDFLVLKLLREEAKASNGDPHVEYQHVPLFLCFGYKDHNNFCWCSLFSSQGLEYTSVLMTLNFFLFRHWQPKIDEWKGTVQEPGMVSFFFPCNHHPITWHGVQQLFSIVTIQSLCSCSNHWFHVNFLIANVHHFSNDNWVWIWYIVYSSYENLDMTET